MNFYLTAPDGSRIHFPVAPETIDYQYGSRLETFSVLSLGEITLPRGTVPARFSWSSFFPGELRRNLGIVPAWRPPKELEQQIKTWISRGQRLRFLVTETSINVDVYIDSFRPSLRGGHGDIHYSIELVEARHYTVTTDAPTAGVGPRARPTPPPPRTYTVKPGDSLWAIARRVYGDGSKWRVIYDANRNVIGKNPNLIYPGQVLRIP